MNQLNALRIIIIAIITVGIAIPIHNLFALLDVPRRKRDDREEAHNETHHG